MPDPVDYMKREDRYAPLLRNPEWECPHGNGFNCECQLPVYEGLYVLPIRFSFDSYYRNVIGRAQLARDGGMIQLLDPQNHLVVLGSAGQQYAWKHLRSIEDWLKENDN